MKARPAPQIPRGRRWLFRGAAMLLPLAVLGGIELGMRWLGVAEDAAGPWQNPYVTFEPGTVFFPDWKNKLAMPKPAGTFRLFALGGSTTYGLGVEHPYAELLADALNRRGGGRRYEVINGGVPAAGSHRVFEVLKEAAQFDPDLVLVLVGHNEFLEEVFFAPDSVLGKQQRVRRFASHFRLVRWLSRQFDFSGWQNGSFHRATLQRHFFGNMHFPLIRTPEQYRARLAFLDANLELMVRFADQHRFRLVLMPEVANLMAPPGDSVHGPGFQEPDRWAACLATGQQRLVQGQPAEARAALQQAAVLDPAYAMTHYAMAQALITQGDFTGARQELERANALDRRGDRINGDLRRTIAAVAARTGTPLLDVRPDLYEQPRAEYGPFGERLFLDHCHPTQAGHQLLARRMLRFLSEQKLIP